MKNTKKLLIFIAAITVLVATVFSIAIPVAAEGQSITAGSGTSIDEYTTKKITAYYSFEDNIAIERIRGAGGIWSTNNVRPEAHDIYTGEFSAHYYALDYYGNNGTGSDKHAYAEPTVGSLDNVEETPVNGYVAEFDIAFFSKLVYETGLAFNKDGDKSEFFVQEYLYVKAVDENGNYIKDADGNFTFVQEVDAYNQPVFEPVYEQEFEMVEKTVNENGTNKTVEVKLYCYDAVYDENGKLTDYAPRYKKDDAGNYVQVMKDGQPVTAPVYKKQLDAEGNPIRVDKVSLGDFDGLESGFSVQMLNNDHTTAKGYVNLINFATNKTSRNVTLSVTATNLADIPDDHKTYVFPADEWLHITIQYDSILKLTNIYIGRDDSVFGDSVGRRLIGTVQTVGKDVDAGNIEVPVYPLTFRLGVSSYIGEVGLDNFIGYQGTTVHNPSYLTGLAAYNRFLYMGESLADSSVVATDRYQAYNYIKNNTEMQSVLSGSSYGKDDSGNEIPLYNISSDDQARIIAARNLYNSFYNDEMDKNNDGVYDALVVEVQAKNAENYKMYVDIACDIPRLITNVTEREMSVNVAETFVANVGNLIDLSSQTYLESRARLTAVKNTLAGDAAAFEFVRLMNIFDTSASYGASASRLQAHFNNASAYLNDITDYNEFDASDEDERKSYDSLKKAVDSYNSAASVMNAKNNEVNTVRFINIVNVMQNKTSGSWANDGAEIEDLWYRARQILTSGNYDPTYEGFETAKVVFDLADAHFWNALQDEHIAILSAKLDSYNEADKSYIDRAGICTFVDRYVELNSMDIDLNNDGIKKQLERNESYRVQLGTLVNDYKNLLVQNTTKFINVMTRAAEYDDYANLKPLIDEATTYYYAMNVEGEGIEARVAQYNELVGIIKDIEADSSMFVAVVNGTAGFSALNTLTSKADVYKSLSACYACLGSLDMTYEGVAAAKEIYDAKYAEYTDSVNVLNAQIAEANGVAFSVRGNWDIDGIVAFVKNLIDMIKE